MSRKVGPYVYYGEIYFKSTYFHRKQCLFSCFLVIFRAPVPVRTAQVLCIIPKQDSEF